MTQAAALLAGFKADHVLADKGYDGRCVIDAVNESGAMPVIPSRKNARKPRQTDMALYKERNIVERFFGYLKQFRRVATRYDKHIQKLYGLRLYRSYQNLAQIINSSLRPSLMSSGIKRRLRTKCGRPTSLTSRSSAGAGCICRQSSTTSPATSSAQPHEDLVCDRDAEHGTPSFRL